MGEPDERITELFDILAAAKLRAWRKEQAEVAARALEADVDPVPPRSSP